MQPHNDDQRPKESDSDGRRDAESVASATAIGMALATILKLADRKVHLAEPGKPVNMSASIGGDGGVSA